MSGYRTHTKINLFVALPICTAAAILLLHPPLKLLLLGIGVFTYGTLFMSPDVDLAYQTKLMSVRGILSLPFRTYAMVFKHRGLSHSFFFGTLTRILWLLMYVLIGFYIAYECVPTKHSFLRFFFAYKPYLFWGFGGLFLADTGHLIMDRIHSAKARG